MNQKTVLFFQSSFSSVCRRSAVGVQRFAAEAGWRLHVIHYANAAEKEDDRFGNVLDTASLLSELDRILPGRTANRDLVADLIEALSTRGIRFIAYYNHSCNGSDDLEWKKACGYAAGRAGGGLDRFAANICGIVGAISQRYGDGIDGWWFDSGYSVDPRGPLNTVTCDMGDWRFPWGALADAAQSGNRDAALAFNSGVGRNFTYTDRFTYYAGEAVERDEPFGPPPLPEKQDHRWICLDSRGWVFSKPQPETGFEVPSRFTDDALSAYMREHVAAGRMVTFNILVDADGRINPAPLAQLRRCVG